MILSRSLTKSQHSFDHDYPKSFAIENVEYRQFLAEEASKHIISQLTLYFLDDYS